MKRLVLAAVLSLMASPVSGQALVNGVPPGLPTQADVSAAVTAAAPDCSTPMPDTLTGSPGTGPKCMPRVDATRPTQVQPVRGITLSDGTWSVVWPTPFPTTPTVAIVTILGATSPHGCQPLTLTTTGATGFCYQLVTNTLPTLAAALPGLVLSPYKNPAAGLPVLVVGRQ